MKLENSNLLNNRTNNRPHEPFISSAANTDGAWLAGPNNALSLSNGERNRPLRVMLAITGAALCMSLGSCIPFYDDGYSGGSTTYTTYQPGYRVVTLPTGYRTETISGNTYHYHNGTYYRRSSGGYVVTDAPRNSRYYQDYGRIRQATPERGYYPQAYDSRDRRYERGDIITRLPDGYRVVNHRGRQYYQVGDRYYVREDGAYAAVGRPY